MAGFDSRQLHLVAGFESLNFFVKVIDLFVFHFKKSVLVTNYFLAILVLLNIPFYWPFGISIVLFVQLPIKASPGVLNGNLPLEFLAQVVDFVIELVNHCVLPVHVHLHVIDCVLLFSEDHVIQFFFHRRIVGIVAIGRATCRWCHWWAMSPIIKTSSTMRRKLLPNGKLAIIWTCYAIPIRISLTVTVHEFLRTQIVNSFVIFFDLTFKFFHNLVRFNFSLPFFFLHFHDCLLYL